MAGVLRLRPSNGKGGPRGLSEGQVAEALRKTGGNVLAASQMLGVTDSAIWQRLSNHPELAAIRAEANAKVTELAKHKIIKRIERDDWNALNLWLTTQGGWSKRTELSGVDGAPISAEVKVSIEYVAPKPVEDEG